MFGGTLGNPIKKNKLFNFFSIEDWKVGYPNSYQRHRADGTGSSRAISRSRSTLTAASGRFSIRGLRC